MFSFLAHRCDGGAVGALEVEPVVLGLGSVRDMLLGSGIGTCQYIKEVTLRVQPNKEFEVECEKLFAWSKNAGRPER